MRGASRWAAGALAAACVALAGALAPVGQAQAQVQPGVPPGVVQSGIVIVQQELLFEGSAFGRASLERREAATRALLAENRQIEAALEAEERRLTDLRPTLPPAEFRALADAFNDRVEGIRTAQDAKSRAIARFREEDRTRFLQIAVPVLAEIMAEMGAEVILDQQSVVLSFDRVDITATAIARIDRLIGDGDVPDLPKLPDDADGAGNGGDDGVRPDAGDGPAPATP